MSPLEKKSSKVESSSPKMKHMSKVRASELICGTVGQKRVSGRVGGRARCGADRACVRTIHAWMLKGVAGLVEL